MNYQTTWHHISEDNLSEPQILYVEKIKNGILLPQNMNKAGLGYVIITLNALQIVPKFLTYLQAKRYIYNWNYQMLQVNISPSLHSSSPLDLAVKGPMVRDLLNMAGYQVPSKLLVTQQEEILSTFGLKDTKIPLCFDKRLYTTALSKEERNKHSFYQQNCTREEVLLHTLPL